MTVYKTVLEKLRKTDDLSAIDRDGRTISAWKQEERQAFLEFLIQEKEATLEEDRLTPNRFFPFYTDDQIQKTVSNTFDIHDFKTITVPETVNPEMHVQRLILRKFEKSLTTSHEWSP